MNRTSETTTTPARRLRSTSPGGRSGALSRRRSAWWGAVVAAALVTGVLTGCSGTPGPTLPSGFPTSEVPVAAGETQVSSGTGEGWTYAVTVKDAAAQEAALQKLRDTGYIVLAKNGDAYTLTGPRFNITLTKSKAKDGTPQVEYQVAPRPGAPTAAPTPTPTSTKK